jgi:hypothetical protein
VPIDYELAFEKYNARFDSAFGPGKPVGSYVKSGKHMVCRLEREELDNRLDVYVRLHQECRKMIDRGSTISDVLVLELEEAAAWVVVKAPNVREMFRGEIGTIQEAAPNKLARDTITD